MAILIKISFCVLLIGLLLTAVSVAEDNAVFLDRTKANAFQRSKRYVNKSREMRKEMEGLSERIAVICHKAGKRHCRGSFGGRCC